MIIRGILMHISTQLDVDVIALESDDHVSLLVEMTAPLADPGERAASRTLVVVLDRSGSMSGACRSPRSRASSRASSRPTVARSSPAP